MTTYGVIETSGGPRRLGYLPDLLDRSEKAYRAPYGVDPVSLPDESPDYVISRRTSDQGSLGSCTGQMAAGMKEDQDLRVAAKKLNGTSVGTAAMHALAQAGIDLDWSRLFAYLLGRLRLQGLTLDAYIADPAGVRVKMSSDTGALISHVIDGLNAVGCMSEALWPYVMSRFPDLPDAVALAQAKRNEVLERRYVQDSVGLRAALHEGWSVGLGFIVYDQFSDVAQDGLWRKTSGSSRGGHAVQAVKHVASKVVPGFRPGAVLCRNSWGLVWGCEHPTMASMIPGRGFFWIPDEVIDSRDVDDIWAVRQQEV